MSTYKALGSDPTLQCTHTHMNQNPHS